MKAVNNILQSKLKRGVITMAIGKPEFVDMAVDMALSYKYFNDELVSCIVDHQTKKLIEENYSAVFDHLLLLPESYNVGRIRKFSCAELTPYESAIFIDSDILLLSSISHLWTEAESNNYVTMIGHYINNTSTLVHHGYSISELIDAGKINQYLKTNSGFFHFMKEPSKMFFNECIEKYKELMDNLKLNKDGWLEDEIAIGIAGHKFNVSCFTPPSPMMWDNQLATLKRNDNTFPICHFIAPIPSSTVKWMVDNAKQLRKLDGLSTGGEKVWIRLNNKRIMSRKQTLGLRIKNKINRYISSLWK